MVSANVRETLWLTAAGATLLLLLGGLVARAISVRIGRSIRALSTPALALGSSGPLSIPPSQIVEVDELGQALMKASRLIEQRAIERDAAEMRERSMAVAKEAAEQASHAKSEFLASMSHELRTPLTAISGYAQLLSLPADASMSERQIRYAENIMSASDQLNKIIGDILELARIEAGQVNLHLEVIDCLDVMTEVCETLEVSAKERGIQWTTDTSANLPYVLADRGRLIQVLLNLGSNAIKYNVEGGRVLLTAYPNDGMVRFVVEDTGKGIPAEQHPHVFESFNRLGAEQGQEEGTGIGLAISRRLVQAMQGEIGFASVVRQGSQFWVDLPVALEAAPEGRSRAMPPARVADDRPKILYIEDKAPNLELMRSILRDWSNAQFLEARTVQEGIRLARALKPHFVITDIHLPDGKGFDVLASLRADAETRHIRIAALTADAMRNNMELMQSAGFDLILTKPFKIAKIIEFVRSAA